MDPNTNNPTPPAVDPTAGQAPVDTGVPGAVPTPPTQAPDPATPVVETPTVPGAETPAQTPGDAPQVPPTV